MPSEIAMFLKLSNPELYTGRNKGRSYQEKCIHNVTETCHYQAFCHVLSALLFRIRFPAFNN